MGVIRRAAKNVIRVPGRSIMLGIVFVVVAVLVMFGLSIEAGSQRGIVNARKSLGNEVSLTQNTTYLQQQMAKNGSTGSAADINITESLGKKLVGLPYLSGYDFYLSMGCLGSPTPVSSNTSSDSTTGSAGFQIHSAGENPNAPQPQFRLIGDSTPSLDSDFSNGTDKITDGRFINASDKNAAVISNTLADKNNLKVGSTFSVQSMNSDQKETLTVVGIYQSNTQQDLNIPLPSFALADNNIYTSYSVAKEIGLSGNTELPSDYVSGVNYYVDDPMHIAAFQKEASSRIDTTKYTLDANDSTYQKMVGPLQKLSQFAQISIIAIVIAAAIILILMMTLSTRERKYEVGILRSLGAKRRGVAAQFAAEAFIVCIIGLFVGGVIGGVTSQSTADYLLSQEVASQQAAQSQAGLQGGGARVMVSGNGSGVVTSIGNTAVKAIDTINAIVSLRQLGELILIGLLLAVFGSLVSTYWIMKVEPMKILSNRN